MNTLSIILIISTLSVIFILHCIFKITFRNKEDVTGIMKNGYKAGSTGIEKFSDLNPAELSYKVIGNIDGRKLTNCPQSKWRHSTANEKLLFNSYAPQGTPLPILPSSSGKASMGPTVDGTENTPKDMFIFAHNQCKPECCPSTYSCDKGCICTTEQQRKFIGETRGNNKKIINDEF